MFYRTRGQINGQLIFPRAISHHLYLVLSWHSYRRKNSRVQVHCCCYAFRRFLLLSPTQSLSSAGDCLTNGSGRKWEAMESRTSVVITSQGWASFWLCMVIPRKAVWGDRKSQTLRLKWVQILALSPGQNTNSPLPSISSFVK